MDSEGTCVSQNFDGTVRAASPANSSAASLPGINERPGTNCSLRVKEEKEDSSFQIYLTV